MLDRQVQARAYGRCRNAQLLADLLAGHSPHVAHLEQFAVPFGDHVERIGRDDLVRLVAGEGRLPGELFGQRVSAAAGALMVKVQVPERVIESGTTLVRVQQRQQLEVVHRADKGLLHDVVCSICIATQPHGIAAEHGFVFLVQIGERHGLVVLSGSSDERPVLLGGCLPL